MINSKFEIILLITFICCDILFGVIAYMIGDVFIGILDAIAIVATALYVKRILE